MIDLEFEHRLHEIAGGKGYPRTPDIAGSVRARLRPMAKPRVFPKALAWSLALIILLFSTLTFIPPARAAILEFIQIGIVRIFPLSETPIARPPITATPQGSPPMTATPASPSSDLIPTLNRVAGETTLAEAQSAVSYPILLPTYPPGLGAPDHVFIQEVDGAMTVFVWSDPNAPGNAILSLHFIPGGSWAIRKFEPVTVDVTEVGGQRAIWAEGPYFLELDNGIFELTRLIEGHVLIWMEGDLTMRLETGLSMQDAVRIAESLQPIR